MDIDFSQLGYSFSAKPLLVGGKAMEYYRLRTGGHDADFIVAASDYGQLAHLYPACVKVRFDNFGVCLQGCEFWRSLVFFGYDFLAVRSIEEENYKVISLERLLFLEALAIARPRNETDLRLVVTKIHDVQYGRDRQFDTGHFQAC